MAAVHLLSKQWSCASLLRGQAYMAKQKFQLDESLSVEEKLAVPWIYIVCVCFMHIG